MHASRLCAAHAYGHYGVLKLNPRFEFFRFSEDLGHHLDPELNLRVMDVARICSVCHSVGVIDSNQVKLGLVQEASGQVIVEVEPWLA
jgi:hypothetical protein